jgi:predicted TIM-barrel fold metal-dependent hydrolase
VGANEIVASMDDQGVDKSVVFGFPWKTKETFQAQHDYIMEVVARYPERLMGLCCFDPFHREAVPEAVRCIEGAGKTPNTMKQIYNLIKKFPENKIVLAHWGGGIFFFNLLKKDVKERLENVYFDTAASPFLYDPRIYRYAKEIAGLDKILFGSDFPLIKPARYFKELEKTGLSQDEIESICGRNAARLLKL